MAKSLPYDKTVVSEVRIQLADLLHKTTVLKSSVAAPIPTTDAFNQGDATLTSSYQLVIPGANSYVILSSLSDFEIVIEGQVLTCRGLFLHNGSTPILTVRAPANIPSVRIQYIYS